jgi:mutator protein MutT
MKNGNIQRFPLSGVRAIIQNNNNEILFLKRADWDNFGGKWCLPGGKIDFGQKVEDAVKREIKEETNLDCTSTQFLFYLDRLPVKEGDMHLITFYFLCNVKGDIKLNDESAEFKWVDKKNYKDYDLILGNDEGIRRFLEMN